MQYDMKASANEQQAWIVAGRRWVVVSVMVLICISPCRAPAAAPEREAAAAGGRKGLELLLTRAYLPPDFDQEVFDELWRTWEEPSRSRAERLDLAGRRRMAMERYGLVPHPDDPS